MTEEVLDIGCGNNPIEGAIGVDIRDYENADYQGDARDMPFLEDNRFDRVNASQFLEHLEHDEIAEVLEEVYRIMKPGGILTVDVPYARAHKDDPTHQTKWYFKTIIYYLPRDEVARLGFNPNLFPDYYGEYDFEFTIIDWDVSAWLDIESPVFRPFSFAVREASKVITTDKWDGCPLIGGLVAGEMSFTLQKR